MYLAKISIQLKESVLDPQGQAVLHALHSMGHSSVADVRVGKMILLRLDAPDRKEAENRVKKYCDDLLANPVIETYGYDLEEKK